MLQRHHTLKHTKLRRIALKTTKTTAIRITWTIQRHVPDSNETSHPAHRHTICSLQPHQPLPYRNSNTNSFESTTISSQKFNISTPIDAPMFTSLRTDTYRTLVAKPQQAGYPLLEVIGYRRNSVRCGVSDCTPVIFRRRRGPALNWPIRI